MEFPDFELLHFLHTHVKPGVHNLAESDWFGTPVEVTHSRDYNEKHGLPELRETLAEMHGVEVEQLLLTAGASEANFLLAATLLSPGDGCIVETPGYAPLRGLPHGCGATARELLRRPDEGFTLDAQRFRSLLPARLAFVTNLHNPSGVRANSALLRELGGAMVAGGGLLVVDEIFRPLAADLPTVAGAPGIAVTGSLSKCYGGTATRVGWVVAEPELVARLTALKQWTNPGASPSGERAGLAILREADARLAVMRECASGGGALVRAACEAQGWEWFASESIIGFPRVGGDTLALAERLAAAGVVVCPGEFFGMPGHLRLGWGIPRPKLEAALEALGAALG
ncbi:MAG: pyridoxal phosphate-dependent aminotransferase [Candidatus Thermoplasmatota archaeon]|nr:pyridoxal phosphate-dependent aminotransferase [Candidatus Thermoplasmatota archaeon]